MRRQIIKTRPRTPYIIARIVIIVALVAAAIAGGEWYSSHHHAHAAAPWQEHVFSSLNSPGPLRPFG
jgi:hypothetical protein